MTKTRPLFWNLARGILVSRSFVQVTEGAGSVAPFTSQVKIASSPILKLILSGSSRTKGGSKKVNSNNVQR